MRKKWSREAFEKKFGSVEWSQNKNTPEAKESTEQPMWEKPR